MKDNVRETKPKPNEESCPNGFISDFMKKGRHIVWAASTTAGRGASGDLRAPGEQITGR